MSFVVKCPNCGTEFEPVKGEMKNETTVTHDMNGVGYLIPKAIHNDNLPRDEKGRFVKRETTTTEYGTETLTTNTENKENNTMDMNNFSMDMLAQMVAERMKSEMTQVARNVANETRVSNGTVDGGMWAKNSQFYGKEICGFMYNPYLVRRFLPAQFMAMMNENDWNVDQGIRHRYNYSEAMIYLREECDKLAMLQKRDKIAFDERREFWSENDIKEIFIQYLNDLKSYVKRRVDESRGKNFWIKGIGLIEVSSKEVVEKHKAVWKYSFDKEKAFAKINMLIADLKSCRTYKDISNTLTGFKIVKIPSSVKREWRYDYYSRCGRYTYVYNYKGYALPKQFINNFKKAGAYYTLKNLIMFDNVKFEDTYGREAILKLRNYLYTISNYESYKFYAKLKDVIRENGIDVSRYGNK